MPKMCPYPKNVVSYILHMRVAFNSVDSRLSLFLFQIVDFPFA